MARMPAISLRGTGVAPAPAVCVLTGALACSPLMRQLNWPTLFCHRLIVENDRITGYQLRQPSQKQKSVAALKSLNSRVISAGDSYNDTAMLAEADTGFLIFAPEKVKAEFPQFKAVESHAELLELIKSALA